MLSALLLAATLSQVDMTPMLQRGPLVLVEEAKGGKFGQATGIVMIEAPVDRVWDTLLKMEDFKNFMPKVLTSELVKKGEKDYDMRFVIDVPGPDTDYTVRYTPNAATKTIEGNWVSGDLKGSRWMWKAEGLGPNKTLLTHTLSVKNFSGLAQSLEDEQQTVTVGVNVGSVLAATKAVKRRCEQPVEPAPAAAK